MFEVSIAIALVTGIVEAIKMATGLNSKYAPILSLGLGILLSGFFGAWNTDMIFSGIVVGLSASGLYSGGKTILKK